MSIMTVLRAAALVALLAPALPAPASAQLGFIKKQLKQKIAQTAVDSAMSKVSGPSMDSTGSAATQARSTRADSAPPKRGIGGFLKKRMSLLPGLDGGAGGHAAASADGAEVAEAGPTSRGGAVRASANRASEGPQFDEFVIEITPRSLDRLEKFLAAQKAAGESASSRRPPAPASPDLNMVQMGMMTQRVMSFCAAATPSGNSGAALAALSASNGLEQAYTPSEMAVLRPRCGRLMALLGEDS